LQLGIQTKLHDHVGRETFATNFIQLGGKAEVLQKLLNHSKISTTMRYVHVDDEMKCDTINALDALCAK
jgi:site-specific recombinase XerD